MSEDISLLDFVLKSDASLTKLARSVRSELKKICPKVTFTEGIFDRCRLETRVEDSRYVPILKAMRELRQSGAVDKIPANMYLGYFSECRTCNSRGAEIYFNLRNSKISLGAAHPFSEEETSLLYETLKPYIAPREKLPKR